MGSCGTLPSPETGSLSSGDRLTFTVRIAVAKPNEVLPFDQAMKDNDPIVIVAADSHWPQEFRAMATPLRKALGDAALRIDHIGSTAVPGLDAKPVIDVQVSVATLEPDSPFRAPLESLGYVAPAANLDRSKRFFREAAGGRRTHVHVRRAGSFDEQLNLLLRDYLRTHSQDRDAYARAKRELAARFRTDREGYVRAKEPTVWSLLLRAHDWLQETGWSPGPSDA
jgi:GrpB-like predicted nucleotidyltransferase (UPF0157 family)